jgi:PAS domain S-box-containing protein
MINATELIKPHDQLMAVDGPDGVLVITGDTGKIVYCNPQITTLSGYSVLELLNHNFIEFLHPQEQINLLQNYRDRLAGKALPEKYESRIVAKDGRILFVRIKVRIITWNDQPADFITIEDLADLRWLNRFIGTHVETLDALGECVTVTDRNLKILYMSSNCLKAAGLEQEEVIGQSFYKFQSQDILVKAGEIDKVVLIEGKAWQGETAGCHPGKGAFKALINVNPLFNEKGKITGMIALTVDSKASLKVEALIQPLSRILNSIAQAVTVTDRNGTIVYISDTGLKRVSQPRDAFIGHNLMEFLMPVFGERYFSILSQVNRGVAWQGEVTPLISGSVYPGWVHVSPLFSEEGDLVGTVGVTVNIREHPKVVEQTWNRTGIQDSPGESFCTTDLAGILTFISESALKTWKWKTEERVGHSIAEFVSPEFHKKIPDILELIKADKTWLGVIPLKGPKGNITNRLICISPRCDDAGSIIGSKCITLNNKERIHFKETKPAADKADQLKQIQSQFEIVREQLVKIGYVLTQGRNLNSDQTFIQQHHRFVPDAKTYELPAKLKTRLEVYCLGTLNVCSSDKKIRHWRNRRAKLVFEYLLNKPGIPVARDVLMEVFWPDHNPRAAANSLKTVIHDLRLDLNQLLENNIESIVCIHGGYTINTEIDLVIDVEEFVKHRNKGRILVKEGISAEAIVEFEKALASYRGDYLEDEPYEEWITPRREALKDSYLLILDNLMDLYINCAGYEDCITNCHKVLASDSCREDVYRKLMLCYSRLGQRTQAIHWYQTCCKIIQSQLDSPPDKETTNLYNRLLKNKSI